MSTPESTTSNPDISAVPKAGRAELLDEVARLSVRSVDASLRQHPLPVLLSMLKHEHGPVYDWGRDISLSLYVGELNEAETAEDAGNSTSNPEENSTADSNEQTDARQEAKEDSEAGTETEGDATADGTTPNDGHNDCKYAFDNSFVVAYGLVRLGYTRSGRQIPGSHQSTIWHSWINEDYENYSPSNFTGPIKHRQQLLTDDYPDYFDAINVWASRVLRGRRALIEDAVGMAATQMYYAFTKIEEIS